MKLILLENTEKNKLCEEKAPMINFIFKTPQVYKLFQVEKLLYYFE